MNNLRKVLLSATLLAIAMSCYADFEQIGEGFASNGVGNVEEGRFLGLLKKGKGRVETYTNFVPYPYPVPVAVPVYQKPGLPFGKLGLGKDTGSNGYAGQGFGQGYYPFQGIPYQNAYPGSVGYGGFGPGFGPGYGGYFK